MTLAFSPVDWARGNRGNQLEIALDQICEKLQLSATQRKEVQRSYEAVSTFIEEDLEFFGKYFPVIHAYGSYAIGTTLKPRQKEEFDLDFIIILNFPKGLTNPLEFRDKLYNYLNSNGRYKGKLKKFRYGVRINYANQFHMDIMPSCLISNFEERSYAPDTKKSDWAYRNCRGFTKWFESQFIADVKNIALYEYYNYRHSQFLLQERAEPLPQQVPYQFTQPLQRAVQLLKRYRDIYFENDKELAVSSVILTTIAGLFYRQETSIYDTLDGIISRVKDINEKSKGRPFKIYNPADLSLPENQRECFSTKWEERKELYPAFINFLDQLAINWSNLKNTLSSNKKTQILKQLFGEGVTKSVLNENRSILSDFTPVIVPNVELERKNLSQQAKYKPWMNIE